jgi:signal transduction histidine kinase/CheY-like chemotaxis protein
MKRSRWLDAYVAVVVLAALAALAWMGRSGLPEESGTFVLLVVLAAVTSSRPVRFEGLKVQLTVSHPFVICALGALGPFAAMIVSLATVGGSVAARQSGSGIRLVFNAAAQPLSAYAASLVFVGLGAANGQSLLQLMWPLMFATAAFFLANTFLVSAAVALEKRQSMVEVWKKSFSWTAVSYLTGVTLAVGMLLILEHVGPWGLGLAVPPCWLLLAFYRTHRERLEEQQRRIAEVERLNAVLEAKVAERTAELQTALLHIEEANQELRETNTRIVEASRAKSEFLANVSHELRTPLNAVIGFSDLLADSSLGSLNARQRDLVGDIGASGEHLLNLINDILDLSKMEAGKLEVHRAPMNVHEMVRRSVAMVKHQAEKKRLELSVAQDAGTHWASLDPGMFRGVLVNLLSNAVKFTPPGGRITVEVAAADDDLLLSVEDDGIGIPEAEHERVFQEFFQVDGSYNREHQGTGLGLALVRKMVGMHGGTVTVASRPGQGARFTCSYPDCLLAEEVAVPEPPPPAERVPVARSTEPSVAPPRSPASKLVLLVEDHALNRKLARNALRSRGFRVLEAGNGDEALQQVRRHRPDLILMDLELPGPDGLEITRRLKADPSTSGIRVVAVTAHAERISEREAREAGCAGFIEKPIRLARFPSQIEALLSAEENVA